MHRNFVSFKINSAKKKKKSRFFYYYFLKNKIPENVSNLFNYLIFISIRL